MVVIRGLMVTKSMLLPSVDVRASCVCVAHLSHGKHRHVEEG